MEAVIPADWKGKAIPIAAKVVAVTYELDALMSWRPYKEAWSLQKSVEKIKKEEGRHFDPGVVEAFLFLHKKCKLKCYHKI